VVDRHWSNVEEMVWSMHMMHKSHFACDEQMILCDVEKVDSRLESEERGHSDGVSEVNSGLVVDAEIVR